MAAPLASHRHRGEVSRARRDVQLAWAAVVLLPLAFLAAFAVGEGLISLQGYEVGSGVPPVLPALVATVPALLVFAIPSFVSIHFARRASSAGLRGGWIPAGFLAVSALAFTVLNTIPMGQ